MGDGKDDGAVHGAEEESQGGVAGVPQDQERNQRGLKIDGK